MLKRITVWLHILNPFSFQPHKLIEIKKLFIDSLSLLNNSIYVYVCVLATLSCINSSIIMLTVFMSLKIQPENNLGELELNFS